VVFHSLLIGRRGQEAEAFRGGLPERGSETGVEPVDSRAGEQQKEINARIRMRGTKRQETVKRRVAKSVRNMEYEKRTAK